MTQQCSCKTEIFTGSPNRSRQWLALDKMFLTTFTYKLKDKWRWWMAVFGSQGSWWSGKL